MAELFKLQLAQHAGGAGEVRVIQSSGGEPRQPMTPPFDEEQTAALLAVLEKPQLQGLSQARRDALAAIGVTRDGNLLTPEERNRIVGRRLFEALFPSSDDVNRNVRGALQDALNAARREGGAVPLQLRFDSDAVSLARLPWELICDPLDTPLVAAGLVRLTRYIAFGQPVAPLPASDRLDVLVVTPRPTDTVSLGGEAERAAIEKAFAELARCFRIHVDRLTPPTFPALKARLAERTYHIVHFDGHGAYAVRCPTCGEFQSVRLAACANPDCPAFGRPLPAGSGEGCLAFERSAEDHRSYLADTHELNVALAASHVHLFYASACQSATVGGDTVFSSVAPGLIQAGVPAVVAMQCSIQLAPSLEFARQFYTALARGESIAAAATAGRKMLHGAGDWFIPTVYLRNRDGEGYLFRYQRWLYMPVGDDPAFDPASLRPPDAAPYKFLSPFEITDKAVFFGRQGETRRLAAEVQGRTYVVLAGPSGAGKTSLVNAGLGPELMGRGEIMLTVREYPDDDPIAQVRRTLEESPAVDVALPPDADLATLLDAMIRGSGRRVVLVFDAFERFLGTAQAAQRAAFAQQFTACVRSFAGNRGCLLLVVREDFVGALPRLLPELTDILHTVVAISWLPPARAREAIENPLTDHRPPMRYDDAFVDDILLPELASSTDGQINPVQLQIVCQELYNRALQAGASVIDARLCPAGETPKILQRYLKDAVHELEPDLRGVATNMLKAMVTPGGERQFVGKAELAAASGAAVAQVEQVLDALLLHGLLQPDAQADGSVAYSVGHQALANEVREWFDPEEALDRCAQTALDHAWDDWYEQWSAARRAPAPVLPARDQLLSADRLRQLKARRKAVKIDPAAFCLLLRSAVDCRCDIGYWTYELLNDAETVRTLGLVQGGLPANAPAGDAAIAALAAHALGLDAADLGRQALARGAVAAADGTVRHTASLALGALAAKGQGLQATEAAVAALAASAPPRAPHRQVQALAQMAAAGLPLPQLGGGLALAVSAWRAGIRLWDERGSLAAQALGAAIGGAVLLALLIAAQYIPILLDPTVASWTTVSGVIAIYFYLGAQAALLFAAGRWLLGTLAAGTRGRGALPMARILGGGLGLTVAVLALKPFAYTVRSDQFALMLPAGFALGCALAGGWEFWQSRRRGKLLVQAVAGALAAGLLAAAYEGWGMLMGNGGQWTALPFWLHASATQFSSLAAPEKTVIVMALAVVSVVGFGAGVLAGAAAGQMLWERFRLTE